MAVNRDHASLVGQCIDNTSARCRSSSNVIARDESARPPQKEAMKTRAPKTRSVADTELRSMTLPSPVGDLTLVASDRGLRAVIFEIQNSGPLGFDTTVSPKDPPWLSPIK